MVAVEHGRRGVGGAREREGEGGRDPGHRSHRSWLSQDHWAGRTRGKVSWEVVVGSQCEL